MSYLIILTASLLEDELVLNFLLNVLFLTY